MISSELKRQFSCPIICLLYCSYESGCGKPGDKPMSFPATKTAKDKKPHEIKIPFKYSVRWVAVSATCSTVASSRIPVSSSPLAM